MGGGKFSSDDFATYSTSRSYATKSVDEVINKSTVHNDVLPASFKDGIRESRDSADNPRSTPIIIAGDVTGSMGRLAGELLKTGLAKFATELYARKPVTDPHLLGMAIGDVTNDKVPVQATQYEADIRIVEQFDKLYVEGDGGGNNSESYHVPWVFAAMMTRHDAFEKRGEKGILITYGDERVPPPLTVAQAKQFLHLDIQADISAADALAMAQRTYDVYHLIIEQGTHMSYDRDRVIASWRDLLGQRAILVADSTKLPEIIISLLQIHRAGVDADTVVKSWDGSTAIVVKKAVEGLVPTAPNAAGGSAVVAL